MPEYIKREALLKDISESVVFTARTDQPSLEIRGANKVIDRIKSAPTADVVKVKHGQWHLIYNCANEGVYCSVCNKKVYKIDYANQKIKSPFCPNCGAKMDKKEGAEE